MLQLQKHTAHYWSISNAQLKLSWIKDESTFQSNDDQPTFWRMQDTHVMCPKSKGAGIMVSDFICEQDGYQALTTDEYEATKLSDPYSGPGMFRVWGVKRSFWTGAIIGEDSEDCFFNFFLKELLTYIKYSNELISTNYIIHNLPW